MIVQLADVGCVAAQRVLDHNQVQVGMIAAQLVQNLKFFSVFRFDATRVSITAYDYPPEGWWIRQIPVCGVDSSVGVTKIDGVLAMVAGTVGYMSGPENRNSRPCRV